MPQLHRYYKKKEILHACELSGGIPRRVVERLGVTMTTYYNWFKRYPEIESIMFEAHKQVTQQAEDVVQTAIANGDTQTARWWLQRRDNRFADKQKVAVEAPSSIDIPDTLTQEQIAALRAIVGGVTDEENTEDPNEV